MTNGAPWNNKAATITAGIHTLLLLLCLLIGYTLPASPAPADEMGMEVNLGNSEDGSGDDQPFSTDHPAMQPEERQTAADNNQAEAPANLASEADEDAEPVPVVKSASKKPARPRDQIQRPAPQPKPKLLYPGQTGNGGNSAAINQAGTGEGNGQGTGDKGVPGGTAGAENYSGIPGNGTGGISHSFNDRNMIARPAPDAVFREGGKVVIRVTVNREGLIINKRVVSAANAELGRIALQKVAEVRFNKSELAPPEQFGNITFVFKTRAHR